MKKFVSVKTTSSERDGGELNAQSTCKQIEVVCFASQSLAAIGCRLSSSRVSCEQNKLLA